jgi:hypothetical protein
VQPNQPRDAGDCEEDVYWLEPNTGKTRPANAKARPRLFVTGLSALEKSGPDTGPLVEDNNEEPSDHAIMPARLSLRWSNEGWRRLTFFSVPAFLATLDGFSRHRNVSCEPSGVRACHSALTSPPRLARESEATRGYAKEYLCWSIRS